MSIRLKLLFSAAGYCLVCWYFVAHQIHAGAESMVTSPSQLQPSPPGCMQEPSLSLRLEGGRPVLAGSLPDASAREALHARAVDLYGDDGFDDHLRLSTGLRQAGWVALAPALLSLFRHVSGDASLSVRDRTVVITGSVSSNTERAEILQGLRASVPGDVDLVDRLSVRPLARGNAGARPPGGG